MGMIKNELVKFFVPSRIFIYGGTILLFIFVDNIVSGGVLGYQGDMKAGEDLEKLFVEVAGKYRREGE